jgi:hypothetical protein
VRLVTGQKKAEVTHFKYPFNGHGLSATININEPQWETGSKRLKRISGIGAATGRKFQNNPKCRAAVHQALHALKCPLLES